MSKLYVRGPVQILDALNVMANPDPDEIRQAHEFGFEGGTDALAIRACSMSGPSWTVADTQSHEAIAVGGFEFVRLGVYRSWFVAQADAFGHYGHELTDICRQSIENMLGSAHRLETVSLSNRAKAHRWYELIGLTFEAEHPSYGVTGQAAVTYVRIR